MKSLIRRSVIGTVLAGAVVLSGVSGGGFGGHGAEAAKKKSVTVTVQCHKVTNKDGKTVGFLRGKGTGRTIGEAERNAKKNVQVPSGYYKRHCKKI